MTVAVLPRVTPGDKPLGASVEGLDLSIPLDDAQLRAVRETLGAA